MGRCPIRHDVSSFPQTLTNVSNILAAIHSSRATHHHRSLSSTGVATTTTTSSNSSTATPTKSWSSAPTISQLITAANSSSRSSSSSSSSSPSSVTINAWVRSCRVSKVELHHPDLLWLLHSTSFLCLCRSLMFDRMSRLHH
jgi:hypothetical protein